MSQSEGSFFDRFRILGENETFVPGIGGGISIVPKDQAAEFFDISLKANAALVGAQVGGAACVLGGCQAARLGVELTIRGAAAQAALARAATRASGLAREAAIRGVVATELALARSPVLGGFAAGVKTAVFDAPLPEAFTRRERFAQRAGLFVGAFGDALADLVQ